MILQCVRYVVQNNFFGLETRPEDQQGIGASSAVAGGDCRKAQEKPSEEVVSLSLPASAVGGQRGSEEGSAASEGSSVPETEGQDDTLTCGSTEADQCWDQSLHADRALDPSVPQRAAVEQDEKGPVCQDHVSAPFAPDQIRSTSNVYDDEIWESPGASM